MVMQPLTGGSRRHVASDRRLAPLRSRTRTGAPSSIANSTLSIQRKRLARQRLVQLQGSKQLVEIAVIFQSERT